MDADGSTFEGELELNGAIVSGSVFVRGGTYERVELVSAEVGRNVEANESTIGDELDLNGATVGGAVFLRGGTYSHVDLVASHVGGSVIASQSTFEGELTLSSADVAGSVFLNGGEGTFATVNLVSARIGSNLEFSGATFDDHVTMFDATVRGLWFLSSTNEGDPTWGADAWLDLTAASVGGIRDAPTAWPAQVGLDGFSYETLAAGSTFLDRGRSVEWYGDWLGRHFTGFVPGPFRQLESALRSVGREDAAESVEIKRRDAAQQQGQPLITRGLNFVWGEGIGYGYRPWRAGKYVLVLVAVGFLVAWLGIPRAIRASIGLRSPLSFSITRAIPFPRIGEAGSVNLDRPGVPRPVRWYFVFHTFVGAIVGLLLVSWIARFTAI